MIVVGLYSPMSQSGKSTFTRMAMAAFDAEVIKISGAMKDMCAVALEDLVEDTQEWVDGSKKDTALTSLTSTYLASRTSHMAQALLGRLDHVQTDDGRVLKELDIIKDLTLKFLPVMERYDLITPRDIQKVLGLEWGRTLYGPQFWTRLVADKIDASSKDMVLVDDVRFDADADLIEAQNGHLIRIYRPDTTTPDAHPSEGLLEARSFYAKIDNTSTLEEYAKKVEAVLQTL